MKKHSPKILVAPNGARKKKEEMPYLPIAPFELAEEAEACFKEGASLFHIHVRDDQQAHSLDSKKYKETLEAIKKKAPQLTLQISTETCGIYTPEDQIFLVKSVFPEAFSINLSELIPNHSFKILAKHFFSWVYEAKISVQYICYTPEDVSYLEDCIKEGILPQQKVYSVLFVLGNRNIDGNPKDLDGFLEVKKKLEFQLEWTACAFGRNELCCLITAANLGGNIRIGFENNHYLNNGNMASSNVELIRQFKLALQKI